MSKEISLAYTASANLYAVVKTAAGAYANGTTPEAFNAAHWSSYALALTEYASATGQYWADFPGLAAGVYRVEVYARAGGSPALSDGPPIAEGEVQWSGTAEVALAVDPLPADVVQVLGVAATTSDGTAQGGTSTTITLASSDAGGANAYVGRSIEIPAGLGAGQLRYVVAYDHTTKIATVDRAWDVTPDGTSQYLFGDGDPLRLAAPAGYAQGTLGYLLGHQLGGTFTTSTSSVFSAAALANAGGGGGGGTGTGSVVVDQDYGGAGRLAYRTPFGSGIGGAVVTAYLSSEWQANRTTATARGSTVTVSSGAWAQPLMLDPGVYVLVFERSDTYGVDTTSITVS